jgi:L-fuconolactonase
VSSDRIDSHHHLWRYNERDYVWMSDGMSILRRDFLLPEFAEALRQSGIQGVVTIQARQMIEETRWLLSLAQTSAIIRGVVGWVPLAHPSVREQLEKFAQNPRLKGVRHVLHDEPDDDYMLRDDFNRGVGLLEEYGLVYDILIFERHLPQAIRLVDRHPNQVFIVDHIAKPRIGAHLLSPWREKLRELARRENVYCKVSGMVTEADWKDWTLEDLAPYFDVVLSTFGPKRIMFGSDWPVLNLAASYPRWVEMVQRAFAALSEWEQSRIWGETAAEAYRLVRERS